MRTSGMEFGLQADARGRLPPNLEILRNRDLAATYLGLFSGSIGPGPSSGWHHCRKSSGADPYGAPTLISKQNSVAGCNYHCISKRIWSLQVLYRQGGQA